MKKLLFAASAFLALMGAANASDWKLIKSDTEKNVYIDIATAKHSDGVLHFTLMEDLKPSDGTAWKDVPLSSVTSYVAKCEHEQLAKIRSTVFEGPLANGKVVSVTKFSSQKVAFSESDVFGYIIVNACNDEQQFPERPEK
jgi:opacity protein-like surface antigen